MALQPLGQSPLKRQRDDDENELPPPKQTAIGDTFPISGKRITHLDPNDPLLQKEIEDLVNKIFKDFHFL